MEKNKEGTIIDGSNLKGIVSNLPDFRQEMTLLQFRAKQLGVTVDCSPKYHPEIAGEGIEFCWGIAKNTYRGKSISEKRKKESWMRLVNDCTCNKRLFQ